MLQKTDGRIGLKTAEPGGPLDAENVCCLTVMFLGDEVNSHIIWLERTEDVVGKKVLDIISVATCDQD